MFAQQGALEYGTATFAPQLRVLAEAEVVVQQHSAGVHVLTCQGTGFAGFLTWLLPWTATTGYFSLSLSMMGAAQW